MFRPCLKNFVVLAILLAAVQGALAANYTLKFATMAPDGSAWMQRFEQMKKEVSDATGGQVILNGQPVPQTANGVFTEPKLPQGPGRTLPRCFNEPVAEGGA